MNLSEQSVQSTSLPETDDVYDFLFKVVLIGDAGVGKTCAVQRFKHGVYIERYGNTIGVDFMLKTVNVEGKKVKLQVWDTAGQERFRTITQSYYRGAHGVIVAYDITNMETFSHVPQWVDDVKRYAGNNSLMILMGTKQDLVEATPTLCQVQLEEAERLATHLHMLEPVETSAKSDINIEHTFVYLAKSLRAKHEGLSAMVEQEQQSVHLAAGGVGVNVKKSCSC